MPDAKITINAEDLASATITKVGESMGSLADTTAAASINWDTWAAAASGASDTVASTSTQVEESRGIFQRFGDELGKIGEDVKGLGESITSGIEDPMGSAKSVVSSFLEELGPVGVGLSAIGAAAAGVGTALGELAHHAAEAGESALEFTYITGTAVTQVGALSAGAEIAGGSLGTMESMLTQMQRRLDATGPAADKLNAGLADLGINAVAFRAADPTDRIAMLAAGMQASAGSTNLMSDALAVMGRSGVQNIGFLMKYTDEARESGEQLGVTWDSVTVKAAEDLGVATRTTGVEFSTLTTTIGTALVPATTVAVEGFNRTILALEHIADLGGLVSGGWHLITGAIGETAAAEQNYGAVQDSTNRLWSEAFKSGLDLGDATYDVAHKMLDLGYSQQTVATQTGLSTDEVKKLIQALKDASTAGDDFSAVWQKIADAEAEAGRVDAPLSASLKGQIADYQALGMSVQEIAVALDLSTGQVTAAETAQAKAAAATDAYAKAVQGLIDTLEGHNTKEGETVAALQRVAQDGFVLGSDTAERFTSMVTKLVAEGVMVPPMFVALAKAQTEHADSAKLDATIAKLQADEYVNLMLHLQSLIPVYKDWTAALPQGGGEIQMLNSTTLEFAGITIPNLTSNLQASATAAEEWGNALDESLEKLPTLIERGLTGSGGMTGALKAVESSFGSNLFAAGGPLNEIGNSMTKGLVDTLGPSVGTAFGVALPGIGAVIGPMVGDLIGKIFSIGGPSAAEQAGRKLEASFEEGFGGFTGMMQTVGAAYTTAGLSAQQAQSDVTSLMNAEKQGSAATQTAIDTINANMAKGTADVSAGVQSILDAAKIVGSNFPAALQPVIAALLQSTSLTDAEKTSLEGLSNAGQPAFSDLTAAAGRYGLTLDTIGGKAAQLSISTEADQIESDYKTLVTTSGADSDKVLAGMKTSLNDLVNHALNAGDVLPTAIQPLIEQLLKTGQLTDDAGASITDLSKLKFDDTGDPLATGMSSLTDAINNLSKILGDLPGDAQKAAAGIGGAFAGVKVNIPVNFDYQGGGGADSSSASTGGYVTSRGVVYAADGFPGAPSGTDTIPAWLTPGEAVLNRGAVSRIGRDGVAAINQGATPGGNTDALHAEVAGLRADMKRQADAHAAMIATLPVMLRHAMRGAR